MTLGGREGEKDGGEERRESQGKVSAVTVTCDYGHEVQGHLHCNLTPSLVKGQTQNTITQEGCLNREIIQECSPCIFFVKNITLLCISSFLLVRTANGHNLIKFLLLILPRPWHWTVGASGVVIITAHCAVT